MQQSLFYYHSSLWSYTVVKYFSFCFFSGQWVPSVTSATTSTPTSPLPSWWQRSYCWSALALTLARYVHGTVTAWWLQHNDDRSGSGFNGFTAVTMTRIEIHHVENDEKHRKQYKNEGLRKKYTLKETVLIFSQLPCKVMAVLLHFFFLSAFAWMLVEGLHLYSMVVKVFGSEDSKHFYYYGIGWGGSVLLLFFFFFWKYVFKKDNYSVIFSSFLSLHHRILLSQIWSKALPLPWATSSKDDFLKIDLSLSNIIKTAIAVLNKSTLRFTTFQSIF